MNEWVFNQVWKVSASQLDVFLKILGVTTLEATPDV